MSGIVDAFATILILLVFASKYLSTVLTSFMTNVSRSVDDWLTIARLVQSVATTIGIFIGGGWVLFNFVQSRAYRHRLEPRVTGTVECKDGLSYLFITYELKSVGLPKTSLDLKKSGLVTYSSQPRENVGSAITAYWKQESAHHVFPRHHWIERDETIVGTLLIVFPTCDYLAFRLELTIFTGKLEWNTEAIISAQQTQNGSSKFSES